MPGTQLSNAPEETIIPRATAINSQRGMGRSNDSLGWILAISEYVVGHLAPHSGHVLGIGRTGN